MKTAVIYATIFLSIIFASANSVVLHKVKLDGSKKNSNAEGIYDARQCEHKQIF